MPGFILPAKAGRFKSRPLKVGHFGWSRSTPWTFSRDWISGCNLLNFYGYSI